MKSFIAFIKEGWANNLETSSKLSKDTDVDSDEFEHYLRDKKNVSRYQSSSPDHIIFHHKTKYNSHYAHENRYLWVHKKTGHIDFHMKTLSNPGHHEDEELHHHLYIKSRQEGPSMGKTAFHDIWNGHTGKYGITVHDDQSKGAVRLHKKMRKEFGDKVTYHTYHPDKGAKHLTHGVAVSNNSPTSLRKAVIDTQIVAMRTPKHRGELAKPLS